jgi:hypothetical protein
LQCLGNQIALKKKFGQGLKLALRVSTSGDQEQRVQQVLGLVQSLISSRVRLVSQSNVSNTVVKDVTSSSITLTFAVPKQEGDNIDVAGLFEAIESAKEEIGIIEFALNESTLDDVFVRVVKSSE